MPVSFNTGSVRFYQKDCPKRNELGSSKTDSNKKPESSVEQKPASSKDLKLEKRYLFGLDITTVDLLKPFEPFLNPEIPADSPLKETFEVAKNNINETVSDAQKIIEKKIDNFKTAGEAAVNSPRVAAEFVTGNANNIDQTVDDIKRGGVSITGAVKTITNPAGEVLKETFRVATNTVINISSEVIVNCTYDGIEGNQRDKTQAMLKEKLTDVRDLVMSATGILNDKASEIVTEVKKDLIQKTDDKREKIGVALFAETSNSLISLFKPLEIEIEQT